MITSTRFSRYEVVYACEPASFWRENEVAVVILLTSFCENVAGGGNKLSNVISFIILPSGEVLISINKDNSSNFSGAKKCNEAFRGVNFSEYAKKL